MFSEVSPLTVFSPSSLFCCPLSFLFIPSSIFEKLQRNRLRYVLLRFNKFTFTDRVALKNISKEKTKTARDAKAHENYRQNQLKKYKTHLNTKTRPKPNITLVILKIQKPTEQHQLHPPVSAHRHSLQDRRNVCVQPRLQRLSRKNDKNHGQTAASIRETQSRQRTWHASFCCTSPGVLHYLGLLPFTITPLRREWCAHSNSLKSLIDR